MSKMCIFSSNKLCDDCGECNICDLDSSKICDNCGKCLEVNNNDYNEVIVDSIHEEPLNEEIVLDVREEFDEDSDTSVEYIDDVDGLRDTLEDTENKMFEELFPGFFIPKKII